MAELGCFYLNVDELWLLDLHHSSLFVEIFIYLYEALKFVRLQDLKF